MTAKNTRVKLVTEARLMRHGRTSNKPLHSAWKKWRGKAITVGQPVIPSANWKCTTKFIWPVVTRKVLKDAERKTAWVCCHQIEFPAGPTA